MTKLQKIKICYKYIQLKVSKEFCSPKQNNHVLHGHNKQILNSLEKEILELENKYSLEKLEKWISIYSDELSAIVLSKIILR